MNWSDWKDEMKCEWEFHKRNPVMIIVWLSYLTMFYFAATR
jgi:hypothetical protein